MAAGFSVVSFLHAPVAQVDDARAERPRLGQLEVDPLLQRREEPRAAAEHDRADEEPVLVDQAQLGEGRGQAGAADRQVLARLLLQLGDLLGDAAVASRALPSTCSSVFENTIFGSGFQMRANSSSCFGADGFSSAVSQ